MWHKVSSFLSSKKVALSLLVLVSAVCIAGVILNPIAGKEAIFASLWFNLLLILLIVNIVFCIVERTSILRLSQAGTTAFHLGLVALFVGVVYDQLFFFEGAIRLTEGETLIFEDPASWDQIKKGPFFQVSELKELGKLYLHKLHVPYVKDGRERGIANEIAVGEDIRRGGKRIIYVTRPFRYKGFEFYRTNKDGFSPLFVLLDGQKKVLYGAYAPLQSIKQKDETYLYRSGSDDLPESFNFPQDPELSPVFRLQTVYHPDEIKKTVGDVSFRVWGIKPHGQESTEELFNGKAAFGERVRVGDYFLSMDEVRYWTSMNVVYRPGLPLIFGSFWVVLAGLVLNLILKVRKNSGQKD